MSDCLFCRIVSGEIKPQMVYEDEQIIAIRDINPQAPVHILIIPRKHIATTNDLHTEDTALIGHIVLMATRIAREEAIAEQGYRTVFNCNSAGCQAVYHLHLHLLGGRQFGWPPG